MEMSRREHMRPFQGDQGNDIHQTNVTTVGIQPLLGRSWKPTELFKNRQFSSTDSRLMEETLPTSLQNIRSKFRDPHPYRQKQILQYTKLKTCTSNITPLISTDVETVPQPLISQETLEQLTKLRSSSKLNHNMKDWKYKEKQDSYGISSLKESINMNSYIQEEKNTKQKIDEIIVAAQALREKLKREKETRRISRSIGITRDCNYDQDFSKPQSPVCVESIVMRAPKPMKIVSNTVSNNIPRLMDLKPKIPNLMDLCVTPPDIENVIQENIMVAKNRYDIEPGSPDKCWNCERPGHRYVACKIPKIKKFCFRCGRPGFDVSCCPYCKVIKSLKC